MKQAEIHVTLWPTLSHYRRFASDRRLTGIRLNSAMITPKELDLELETAKSIPDSVPLFFDIKGRQLRVTDVMPERDHLEIVLNHPIEVPTPVVVLFKGGEDHAVLEKIVDKVRLVFRGGPAYNVCAGESLHIRHPGLVVGGELLTEAEVEKVEKVKKAGISGWYLSYVQSAKDMDEFESLVGNDVPVIAKIEDTPGLEYVSREFKKKDNISLMAACGDLFVEIEKPHHIMAALKLIIEKDKEALAGSRMLLSLVHKPVPSMADLLQLAWLLDTGYRRLLLCDEICLKEEFLSPAVHVMESVMAEYGARGI